MFDCRCRGKEYFSVWSQALKLCTEKNVNSEDMLWLINTPGRYEG